MTAVVLVSPCHMVTLYNSLPDQVAYFLSGLCKYAFQNSIWIQQVTRNPSSQVLTRIVQF